MILRDDYALARYNVNRLGRFSSPDPLAGAIGDPQSLNRYAYVQNDPINLTDPLGQTTLGVVLDGFHNLMGLLPQFTSISVDGGGGGDVMGSLVDLGPKGDIRGASGGGPEDISQLPLQPREFHPLPQPCAVTAQTLDAYLAAHNSPLVGQGQNLMNAGRANNVDPRLLVAIAGAETGFGNNITWGQFNAWNWGWNARNRRNSPFNDWGGGVDAVGRGLGGRNYLGGGITDTNGLYLNHYCVGPDCANGLQNINTFLAQQGGNPNQLGFPCR